MEAGPPITAQAQPLHFDGLCRLMGEVKQDCNLTIETGQEARADASGSLGHIPECPWVGNWLLPWLTA
jgi:hypothetical protein